jgi:hypothetical protein
MFYIYENNRKNGFPTQIIRIYGPFETEKQAEDFAEAYQMNILDYDIVQK